MIHQPACLIRRWRAESRDQRFKAAFRRIFPRCVFDRPSRLSQSRSSFFLWACLFSVLRPRRRCKTRSVLSPSLRRYPHFISRESFSVFSGSFHAVYSSKYVFLGFSARSPLPRSLKCSDDYVLHVRILYLALTLLERRDQYLILLVRLHNTLTWPR